MINEFIFKFLFVLSCVYILKIIIEFIVRLFLTDAEPIKISKWEALAHYMALSYIITYLVN